VICPPFRCIDVFERSHSVEQRGTALRSRSDLHLRGQHPDRRQSLFRDQEPLQSRDHPQVPGQIAGHNAPARFRYRYVSSLLIAVLQEKVFLPDRKRCQEVPIISTPIGYRIMKNGQKRD